MVTNYNPLYTLTGSLAYAATGTQMDPHLLRGRTSLYRPSLPLFVDYVLSGLTPDELKGSYMATMEDANNQWALSFQELSGMDITAEGSPGMVGVLPKNVVDFTVYEDEVPNFTKFNTVSATDTGALATKIVFATADIPYFQVDNLIINFSKSLTNIARVTAVSYTDANPYISVTAWAGTAAMSTSIFMASGADAAAVEAIEIIGSANDMQNGTLPSARYAPAFRPITAVSTYNTQLFDTTFETEAAFDPKQRAFGDKESPMAFRRRQDAYFKHVSEISRALIWGRSQVLTGTGNSRTSLKGLNQSIVTNVKTLTDGALALSDIDDILINYLSGTASSRKLYGFCSMSTMFILESLFNSVAVNNGACLTLEKYEKGITKFQVAVVRYRNFEIHFVPLGDFLNTDRTFADPTSSAAKANMAGNLWLVDPEAMKIVVGQHNERGITMMDLDANVETKEESWGLHRHILRTRIGFVLEHEKTSAAIKNILRADIIG